MKIEIEVSEVEVAAERLKGINEQSLVNAQIKAFDAVVDRAYESNAKRMNAGINLEDAYLRRRFVRNPVMVQNNRLTAEIVADGSLTVLGHYNPQVLTRPVRNPSRSKGDASRGIQRGLKAAGVKVEVTRGVPKVIERGFILPLRRGGVSGGNGSSVFTRGPDGKLRNRYGPSVYQLFKHTVEETYQQIADDLEESLVDAVEKEIEETL